MKEIDLEKTQPISVLSEEEITNKTRRKRSSKYEYEEAEEEVKDEEQEELEEEAEEALAEKNIAEAEAYLEAEAKERQKNNQTPKEKTSLIKKLKNKWQKMNKTQKIITCIIAFLILALIITGIVLIIVIFNPKTKKESPAKKETTSKEPPVIVDNFYYSEGKLHILDKNEKEIGTYKCENKDKDLCYVAINKYRDSFDVPKNLDENDEEKIERIPVYDKNYVFIFDSESEDEERVVLYSLEKKKVTEEYKEAKAYDDNYVIVKDDDNKYGLIQIKDGINEFITPKFSYLGMIDGQDNLVAENNNEITIVSKNGSAQSKPITASGDIKYYSNNIVIIQDSKQRYNAYDFKGQLIIGDYDFATTIDKYIFLIDGKNNLYVRDSSNNKYNEEGISLTNKQYVQNNIYNKDGKLTEKQASFKIEINDGVISILNYTSDFAEGTYTNVSISEGEASATLPFYSYFNGKLYYYGDEKKEELLGSYTCVNPNNISYKDAPLDKCYPSRDYIFEDNDMLDANYKNRKSTIPIFNKRYVFINDGNGTVNLYDLVDKKNRGTYSSVNTYSENNDYKLTHKSGSFDIVCLNKKKKYGLITISPNSVIGKYKFNYNKLEKLNDLFIGQETDNKWRILFDEDNMSVPYSGKIRGYITDGKYVKTKTSSGYNVYDAKGNKINSEELAYVELYEDFYAGVNSDKKLMIYNYNGNEIISESIQLNSTTYYQTNTPSFKITYENQKFTISVLDSNNKYVDTTMEKITEEPKEEVE